MIRHVNVYCYCPSHNAILQVADTDVRHTQQQATVLALQGDLTGYEAKCQEYTTQLQDITNRLQAAGVTDQVGGSSHTLIVTACMCRKSYKHKNHPSIPHC